MTPPPIPHPSKWEMTPRQQECLDALVEHGCHKAAAKAVGCSHRTVEQHIWLVRDANGMTFVPMVRILIAWDRWRRADGRGR